MKRALTLARAKSPTSPAKGLRRLPHRLPALRGPEESDVLVHGSRRRWDRLNSNTSETAAHVVIGRPHGLRLGFRDNVFPVTPIASIRLWHKCEVPTSSDNVRVRGQNGKHLLALSFSQFDPNRTCVATTPPNAVRSIPLDFSYAEPTGSLTIPETPGWSVRSPCAS